MTEEWRTAAGTEGRYEVSNLGRVRRIDGLIVTPSVPRSSREYPSVMLRYDGIRKRTGVHRLVALNFLPLPPFAGAEVRHLDGDHTNARADNLAWGTGKDNAADRERHGTTARGLRHGRATLSDEDVAAIRGSAAATSELAGQYAVHRTTIQRIRRGAARAAALRARSS